MFHWEKKKKNWVATPSLRLSPHPLVFPKEDTGLDFFEFCATPPRQRVFLMAQTVKNLSAMQETRGNPWVAKIPWRREWQPTPVFFLGEVHEQRNLAGYSPQGYKELDTTELPTLFFPRQKGSLLAEVPDTQLRVCSSQGNEMLIHLPEQSVSISLPSPPPRCLLQQSRKSMYVLQEP